MMLTLLAWYLMMALLVWSVFHRLVVADKRTRMDVRIALTSMGTACMVGIGAPLYAWEPDFVTLVITLAITIMQVTFARHWRNGTPLPFMEPRHLPKRRKGDANDAGDSIFMGM